MNRRKFFKTLGLIAGVGLVAPEGLLTLPSRLEVANKILEVAPYKLPFNVVTNPLCPPGSIYFFSDSIVSEYEMHQRLYNEVVRLRLRHRDLVNGRYAVIKGITEWNDLEQI